jgi:hypothetical protein
LEVIVVCSASRLESNGKKIRVLVPSGLHSLMVVPKQCPRADLTIVVLPLSCYLSCPCALLHYDLDFGVLASTHSTGGACCASARLDIVYGYHLPSFHRPLELRLHLEFASAHSA